MRACPHCDFELCNPELQPNRGFVICQKCGKYYSIATLPFFVITGGSACGKTTVAVDLVGRMDSCLIIETDDYGLIRESFETIQDFWHYLIFLCKKLSHNGRPVVLSGWVNPSQILASSRTRLFSAVHILVLTCEPAVQTARLEARFKRQERPPDGKRIETALRATQSMKEEAEVYDNVTTLDTTHLSEEQTILETQNWILERL